MPERKSKSWIYLALLRVLPKAKDEEGKSLVLQRYSLGHCSWKIANEKKTSELILMILDATKKAEQRALLEHELESVGIRLNREPPYCYFLVCLLVVTLIMRRNIYLKVKKAGGMKITFQNPPKYMDEKMLYNILRDYKMLNCEVLVRDEDGACPY